MILPESTGLRRKLFEQVASTLDVHNISLDNVYFMNTPNSAIFITNDSKTIFDYPASNYVVSATRRVLFEKTKYIYKVQNFNSISYVPKEASKTVISKFVNANSFFIGQKENESTFMALKRTMEHYGRQHLLFVYVYDDMIKNIEQGKVIRMALLDVNTI